MPILECTGYNGPVPGRSRAALEEGITRMTATHLTFPCRLCGVATLPSTVKKTGGLCIDCWYTEKHRIKQEARAAAPGCAACDGSGNAVVCAFDWEQALSGKGEYAKYPRYLQRDRAVKHGERYACSRCSAVWYLQQGARGARMMLVHAASAGVFGMWSLRAVQCPAHLLDAARAIGAAPVDAYGGGVGMVCIPCSVTTRSGARSELAALVISDDPPIPEVEDAPEKLPRFHLADAIASIGPSRFALPRSVRCAMAQAVEQRMGLMPTGVAAPGGRRYVINGRPLFFERDGFTGAQLRLAGGGRADLAGDGPRLTDVFVADWFEGADDMRIAADPVTAALSWVRWKLRRAVT